MRNFKATSVLALVLLLSASLFAGEEFTIDNAHSNASFSVRHNMISNVPGRFKEISGAIWYDAKDITKSSVKAVIKTASIDTGNEGRDKHLRNPDFFDAEKFPEITFVSKKIEKRGNQLVAIGDFTMHGVTKQIELPFELNSVNTPRGPIIGVDAQTKLNRQDYGISWNRAFDNGGLIVSNDVKIDLSLEARPAKKDEPAKAVTDKKEKKDPAKQ